MEIRENASLREYNTFDVEAKADLLVILESEEDILSYLDQHSLKSRDTLILGGGSNVLFTCDYAGTILHPALKGIEFTDEDDEHVYIKAAAGEVWDDLVNYCINKEYGGLENLSMIPGNVGAAPIQNIGAYGKEQKDHFYELEAISIRDQEKHIFKAGDCRFGYRDSIFKNEYAKKYIITSVAYRLDKKPELHLEYHSLKKALSEKEEKNITIRDVSKAVREIRSDKLPDPEKLGNAGSFFKNPVVSAEKHDNLKKEFPGLVSFELNEDAYKLAAGWMIEQCGWKDRSIGHASVHKEQALVLVNLGKARGNEILHLARMIRMSVEQKFGVELEYEVNIV